MRSLGNILWHFPFLGFVTAFFVFITGILLTLTVVASPIGLGLIEFSKFLLAPYSNEMISSSELSNKKNPLWETYGLIVGLIYLPIGIIMVLCTVFQIVLLASSLIGIPMAIVLAKSLPTYLNPVGKKCVNSYVAEEIRIRNGKEKAKNL
jgi:uncharacterized membrane protein YccF (DUF307 family)